jgi:hypothetical protein
MEDEGSRKKGKAARNKQMVAIEDEVDEEWEQEKMGGKKNKKKGK